MKTLKQPAKRNGNTKQVTSVETARLKGTFDRQLAELLVANIDSLDGKGSYN